MFNESQKELANKLFEIGAVKFGQFRLKLHEKNPEAPLSPIYIDLRILRSFPDILWLTAILYAETIESIGFDILADIPTAATPIVTMISHKTNIPMISPRIQEKSYGSGKLIDGVFSQGKIALVVDDLITKAESKMDAINVLVSNGLIVKDVAVLIDRQQGGGEELANKGYKLHSVYKLKELLLYYLEALKITDTIYQKVVDYLSI